MKPTIVPARGNRRLHRQPRGPQHRHPAVPGQDRIPRRTATASSCRACSCGCGCRSATPHPALMVREQALVTDQGRKTSSWSVGERRRRQATSTKDAKEPKPLYIAMVRSTSVSVGVLARRLSRGREGDRAGRLGRRRRHAAAHDRGSTSWSRRYRDARTPSRNRRPRTRRPLRRQQRTVAPGVSARPRPASCRPLTAAAEKGARSARHQRKAGTGGEIRCSELAREQSQARLPPPSCCRAASSENHGSPR